MFSGIASVLVMIYWDAGPPSAVFFFFFFYYFFFFFFFFYFFFLLLLLFFFFFLFLYLLSFKRLNVGVERQIDRQTHRVTYSEAGDEV